ncbi:hypothetical protein CQ14_17680 [Bradyrhizobium lablabi]|uniref:Uncharacterized protein n=1 Tax=Bradyrhizobium lablabi TaxID=722472 RepID=A0A0R3N0A3_9BRAD|nr:hypothetical protein CQ14_17680 [Bradyrhizobium lablabi]
MPPLDDAGGIELSGVWLLSNRISACDRPLPAPIAVVFDLNTGQCHLQRRLQRHHDLLADDR